MDLLQTLWNLLLSTALRKIHKASVWPHIGYDDPLHEQPFHNSFQEKLKSVQYNACLALAGK